MCVFSCVSTKTGSIWRTSVLVIVGTVAGIATVAVSSSAVSGVDGVARTRTLTFAVVSAPVVLSTNRRMNQSALPVGPQAPHEAHQRTVIVVLAIEVGAETFQIQFGS